ncbi:MAG: endonuclease/exonuclease/phosphatase family metal-dependent hydrolase [Candidatus Krumholzibacteriia bacterium]|jgi:endonuclease/exonuclease/phosphatase family metal-dependent hydrolase
MPHDLTLRVMTFNLLTATKKRRSHPWRLRKRNIAKIFDNLQPDVVGTQEANYQQLLELAELLPDYEFVGEGNLGRELAHDESNWYCATFYRKDRIRPALKPCGDRSNHTEWLSPTPHVPASQFSLGTRPRLVTWNTFELVASGRQFVFGTTHLEAINSGHRKKSAHQLRHFISQKIAEMGQETPVFLTGDFNAVSSSPEIKAMSAEHSDGLAPMFDAWAESYADDEPHCGGTFRGLGLRDKVSHQLLGPRRIDYVFFRPRLAIRSVDRIGFDGFEHRESAMPSDHYPVLAEFSLAV